MSGSLLKFTSKIFPSFEDAGLKRHRLLLYSFSLSCFDYSAAGKVAR